MSNILFVLNIGFDINGPSVHLFYDIFKAALSRGHCISVILKRHKGSEFDFSEDFKSNNNFSYKFIIEDNEKLFGFAKRYFNEIKYSKKCYLEAKKIKHFDLIFIQSSPCFYFYTSLFKKFNRTIILNVQDVFPDNLYFSGQLPLGKISYWFFKSLQTKGYRHSDKIITISDDMKETLVKYRIPNNMIDIIYNWSYSDKPISIDTIQTDNFYDLKLDKAFFNVIYAGNVGKMQNVEILIETAQVAKDINEKMRFYIIGNGSNKQNVMKKAQNLENVFFYNMQSSNYAESIYAQADLNVIPLVKGGIKTALPSKTATCFRVNKPVLFIVDENSSFESLFRNDKKIFFVSNKNAVDVLNQIKNIKNNGINEYENCASLLTSTKNAAKYLEIVEEIISSKKAKRKKHE